MAVTRLTKSAFRQGFAAPLAGLARTGDKPVSPGRSHPEHPEPARLDRRVERGRDPQPQHAPGIGRVDDAVVPQPCGGVPRAALVLVLLADGGLEGLFLFRRPVPAAGLDAVAFRSEEHTSELQSLMRISYAVFCLKKTKI